MWIDDLVLEQHEKAEALACWVPDQTMAILGNANVAETELYLDRCNSHKIPVLKRYGGGGAVILYPGCAILSYGCWVKSHFDNDKYFRILNRTLASIIEENSAQNLIISQRGISDLCIGERKFVGTSLFRSKNYLLFQASIICELNLEWVERYLRHPSREPDYRSGRTHSEFLIGLQDLDQNFTPEHIVLLLRNGWSDKIKENLAADFLDPQPAQFSNLRARLARSKTIDVSVEK